jgi:hypothetical protein
MLRGGALLGGAVALAGMVAATAVARHIGQPTGSPLIAPGAWEPTWWVGLIAAFAGYVLGVVCLARSAINTRLVLALSVLIQTTPLAAPVLLSGDANGYLTDGAASDPYGQFGHLSDAYGPLWTAICRLAIHLGNSTYFFRLLALASVLAMLIMVERLTTRKALGVAFLGWNPLVAVHFGGAGHLDAFMMVLAVGALVLAADGRAEAAGAAWIASVFVKWVTAPLYALFAIDQHRRGRPIGWKGALAATVVVVVGSFVMFGGTWLHAFSLLQWQERQWFSFGMNAWLQDLGLGSRTAVRLSEAAELVAFAIFAVRARSAPVHLGLAAGTLMVLSPKFQPSYLIWGIALAAADENDRWGKVLAVAMTFVLLSDALTSALNA